MTDITSLAVRSPLAEAALALAAEGERTRALGARLDGAAAARVVWDDWTVKDVLGHVESSHGGLLRALRGQADVVPGRDLAMLNEERRRERREWPLPLVLARIDEARTAALEHLRTLGDEQWSQETRLSSGRVSTKGWVAWQLSSHEREHREDVERTLGVAAAEPGEGRVAWLNVSNGGVPKLPVYRAHLGELGLEGDRHRSRSHGGPTAALCLFSLEVIERLRAEGHPIEPGAIGENVTVRGVDWSQVRPGDQLRIGSALVEVTRYTTPCLNIAGAFVGGVFSRVLAKDHPGESRAYARVLEPGEIAVGDPVEHLPA